MEQLKVEDNQETRTGDEQLFLRVAGMEAVTEMGRSKLVEEHETPAVSIARATPCRRT